MPFPLSTNLFPPKAKFWERFASDPTWTRPGPDRVGWLLPPWYRWTIFAIAYDQWKKNYLNARCRYRGHLEPVPLIDMQDSVQNSNDFVADQMRLQRVNKELVRKEMRVNPDHVPHFGHRDRVQSGSGISTDSLLCKAAHDWVRYPPSSQSNTDIWAEKMH